MSNNIDSMLKFLLEKSPKLETSGNWEYVKLDNGVAIAWSTLSRTNVNKDGQTGDFYYWGAGSDAFPSGLFVSPPKVYPGKTYWGSGIAWASIREQTKDAITQFYVHGTQGSGTLSVDVLAIGRWK